MDTQNEMDLKNKIKLWVQGQLVPMPRGTRKKLADFLSNKENRFYQSIAKILEK